MLIPTKKSNSSISVLASYEEKAVSPGATYVPAVSLKYSLPGPIGGQRLPQAPQPWTTQINTSRLRYPRQDNRRNNRRSRHFRQNLAEDCTDAEHQIQGIGIQRQEHLKPIDFFSSSTPTVPFSSSELLYGNDVTSRHQVGGDDVSAGDFGTWGGDKQKLKELDVGNRRPTSRKVPSFDKVTFDREELRPIGSSLHPSKQIPLRANGLKNNLLRADQYLNQRNNAPASGREEDLVAMGTLWSPSQLQTRGFSTVTSSSKSTSATNSAGGGGQYSSSTLPARRPINLSTTTSTRQLLHHPAATTTTFTLPNPGMGNFVKTAPKEVDPKYSDPLVGAPPTFQQRLMELAALEAETVRWERTKKVKKKPKQDRDC